MNHQTAALSNNRRASDHNRLQDRRAKSLSRRLVLGIDKVEQFGANFDTAGQIQLAHGSRNGAVLRYRLDTDGFDIRTLIYFSASATLYANLACVHGHKRGSRKALRTH